MKKIFYIVPMCLALSSCVEINKVADIATGIDVNKSSRKDKKETKKSESPKKEKTPVSENDPINSQYSNLDIIGCIGSIIINAPSEILSMAVDSLPFNGKVDAHLSKELIEKVKVDLDEYVKLNGKISPDKFWSALSINTVASLNFELISNYKTLDDDEFLMRKKSIAYAFLYHLETGSDSGTYKFKFDSRMENEESLKEYISFNGSHKKEDAEDVSMCGYFRFSDVEVETYEEDILNKTICVNKFGSAITLTENDLSDVQIDIHSDIPQSFTLLANDMEVKDRVSQRIIFKSGTYPKFDLRLTRREKGNQSYSKLNYRRYHSPRRFRMDKVDKFTNMSCRTLVNRE